MDQQRRVLIAVVLSVGLSLAYSQIFLKPKLEAAAEAARLEALALADGGVDGGAALAQAPVAGEPDAGAAGAGPTLEAAVAQAPATPTTFELTRPTMKLTFSNQGAGLVGAELTGSREREAKALSLADGWRKLFGATFAPPPQMNLAMPVPGGPPQLGVSAAGAAPLPATLVYQVTEQAPGRVVFTGASGPWAVTKTISWAPDATGPLAYAFDVDVTLKNVSAAPVSAELLLHATRAIQPGSEEAPSLFGGIGNQASVLCRHDDDVAREAPKDEAELVKHTGAIGFVGIDQQYFLSALWPREAPVGGACQVRAAQASRIAEVLVPVTVAPQESVTKRFGAYLGPKDLDVLVALDAAQGAGLKPNLDKTVDFGIWAFLCKVLLWFLRVCHGFAGNWGVAIILLTVTVKVLLLPLTHKAMVSAEQMKSLQPKLEVLKVKFADDREKQNAEMMKLYQEAGVNPLGGCLPLLLQLPIWGALFTTLRTSYELYGEPFYGPVWADLTNKDPTYLLPLALGVTMIITQRFQPQMGDKTQAFMMTWFMPVFFTAMMMNYPAGLALYIFTNNLLSIVQQFALRKYLEAKGQAAPKPEKARATS